MSRRIAWLAGVLVAVLAAYAALGFWLAPWLVQREAAQWAQQKLGRQASIGSLAINPFTLRVEAEGLQLSEADGAPLFSMRRLDVRLQWLSLLARAWRFGHVVMTEPAASLAIAPDGRFNLAELVQALTRDRPPSTDTALPRVVIERLAVAGGRVDMQDRRAGYANTFAPIDFELLNLSTLPNERETHVFTARSRRGGTLRWTGHASLDPIRAEGELVVEEVPLPEVSAYLKSIARASVASGQLSARLPYAIAYADGKLDARLAGARVGVRDLRVAHEGATEPFAVLDALEVSGVAADLVQRSATVAEVRAGAGRVALRRDAKGAIDVAGLMRASAAGESAPAPAASWRLQAHDILLDGIALSLTDETADPPLRAQAGGVRLALGVQASQTPERLDLKVAQGHLTVTDIAIAKGTQPPVQLARLGLEGGTLDLAERKVRVERLFAEGARLDVLRDAKGAINLASWVPRDPSPPAPRQPAAWAASAGRVELSRAAFTVADEASGIRLQAVDGQARIDGASLDLKRPLKFTAGLSLREGGQLATQGTLLPATGAVKAQVKVSALALAPLQPLLAQHVKLHIATGAVSAQGEVTTGDKAALRYDGSFDVAGLVLNEHDGGRFAAWQNVGTEKMVLAVAPNRLDISELRITGADAKLIIEEDRSFNALRLLVNQPAAAPAAPDPAAATAPPAEPFPVRVRRVRVQDAKLDFTDLSLRPQFAAKIHDLSGVLNGLSSSPDARTQAELDGRVDEYGLARVRGELNLFAPANNTDLHVVFRNVDMVAASPYSMKFAGYRIAEGKISLDLQYKVRDRKLEGDNKIVIDKLTLGERVESPDALKIPLHLALAILTDSDGRIDLGLPVSGDLADPTFSYGAVVWKAIGNVLTKIVTAPFRALGAAFGVGGDRLEAITFDAGSARLLPPEREKLKQVAQTLAKRAGLQLTVAGQYSSAADGAVLRMLAVRRDTAQRAGINVPAGEQPGPLDIGDRPVRRALRELYAQRFGQPELDRAMKAAESTPPAAGAAPAPALPVWQRATRFVQGEPQVADASAFYARLRERLEQEQALPADALVQLGQERARAIVAALAESGLEPARARTTAVEAVESAPGSPVPLKLQLDARP